MDANAIAALKSIRSGLVATRMAQAEAAAPAPVNNVKAMRAAAAQTRKAAESRDATASK
jgi:hypothetical protein